MSEITAAIKIRRPGPIRARVLVRAVAVALALVGAGCTGPGEQRVTTTVGSSAPSGTTVTTPTGTPALDLAVVGGRAVHTATTLDDGTLLVAGGCVIDGCGEATAETYLVTSDGTSVRSGPAMSSPRDAHSATLLADGRVVLVGGFAGEGQRPLASIDVFDPRTGAMSRAAPMRLGRGGHVAGLLGDGRVIIAGGWVGPRTHTATTEIFDPATGTTTAGPDLPVAVQALDAVTLADGRVLVTGGQDASGIATSIAAVFDHAAEAWTETGPMGTPRFKHTGVLLPDGRVLIIGGTTDDQDLLATTEFFNPLTSEFSPGPDLAEARYKMQGGAVVIAGDRVVIAGGGRTVEVLDLETGTSRVISTFAERGSFATLNLLGSGDLVVIGGYDDAINLRRDVRLLEAGDP